MNAMNVIKENWVRIFTEDSRLPGYQKIIDGQITPLDYKNILRQIFHHARENPQIQAFATVFFKGEQRKVIKKFYRHAISEIGHDQLALDDLSEMGVDVSLIPEERPLPETTALLSYAFYQIQYLNPVGYLGYLFHLEFMPTHKGNDFLKSLRSIDVPESAMTFIKDHIEIDVGHNKMMEDYVGQLVVTEEDLQSVIYAINVTSKLYEKMLSASIEQSNKRTDFMPESLRYTESSQSMFMN